MSQTFRRNQPEVVPVVIGSSYNAYGIIRSFAEEGIRSILVTGRKKCFAQYSKYLEKHISLPEANADPEGFVSGLLKLGKALSPRRGMFFPTHDEHLIAIAKHADVLSAYFETPFSEWEVCREIIDKATFRARCEALGIPTIRECLANSLPEALQCLEILRLPVIVKGNSVETDTGRFFPGGKMVFYDRSEYESHMRHFFEGLPGESLLVQEYIEDSDRNMPDVNCFTDRNGIMQCVFICEKIRQYPPKTGTSTAMNAVWPDTPKYQTIIEYTQKILKGFRFYGLSGTEFKYDPREKNYKIIETNIRSEFPNYLQTLVGQNMPYQLYLYHLGREVTIPYYPPEKSAQCAVPFNDYFFTVHLNKLNYKDAALTRKAWKATRLKPSTGYGLTARDIRPFLYAYATSIPKGLNAYFRIKNNIPHNVHTLDYIRRGKRAQRLSSNHKA